MVTPCPQLEMLLLASPLYSTPRSRSPVPEPPSMIILLATLLFFSPLTSVLRASTSVFVPFHFMHSWYSCPTHVHCSCKPVRAPSLLFFRFGFVGRFGTAPISDLLFLLSSSFGLCSGSFFLSHTFSVHLISLCCHRVKMLSCPILLSLMLAHPTLSVGVGVSVSCI